VGQGRGERREMLMALFARVHDRRYPRPDVSVFIAPNHKSSALLTTG
jgi:hypothetical protein